MDAEKRMNYENAVTGKVPVTGGLRRVVPIFRFCD
jgi:hypothetical protein